MPNSCWDDAPNLQDVMDAIHAEIKEYGFSKTWHGSLRGFETLKFHLHRMSGIAPFDIKRSPEQLAEGLISVQFSGPAEPAINEAEMRFPPRDLTQRPAGHIDVYNWDEYTEIAHVCDKIRRQLETQNCSAVYYGSYARFEKICDYLKLYDIYATNTQACNEKELQAIFRPFSGHFPAIFRRQQQASSVSSADTTCLPIIAVPAAAVPAAAVPAAAVPAAAVPAAAVPAEANQHAAAANQHKPKNAFWSRRGHPDIRMSEVDTTLTRWEQ